MAGTEWWSRETHRQTKDLAHWRKLCHCRRFDKGSSKGQSSWKALQKTVLQYFPSLEKEQPFHSVLSEYAVTVSGVIQFCVPFTPITTVKELLNLLNDTINVWMLTVTMWKINISMQCFLTLFKISFGINMFM
jgi:hypothetical protein